MEAPKEVQPITGKVLQSMDSGGYTYVYLQHATKGEKISVSAMPTAKMTVGKKVSLVPGEELRFQEHHPEPDLRQDHLLRGACPEKRVEEG